MESQNKWKMPLKGNDNNNKKNLNTCKNKERCRPKKFEKNKTCTSIPMPVTMMRSQVLEKKGKIESFSKKVEGKVDRSKGTSTKQKEPGLVVLERVAKAPKNDILISAISNEVEVPGNKTSETIKLKGFNEILPLCERELRKIDDAWLSVAYCSLSMRANLLKFLSQSFPNFGRGQFYTEDKELVQYIEQLKNSNRAETQNLLIIVKSVLANREKAKDECNNVNKTEREMRKKITQAREENRKLNQLSDLESTKKEDAVASDTEKSQMIEYSGKKRETPLISFFTIESQQNPQKPILGFHTGKQNDKNLKVHNHIPKQNEKSSKTSNTLNPKQNENGTKQTNLQSGEEHKSETVKMSLIKKDFETLKTDFLNENETLEKKVRELENVLQEKIKKLNSEKEVKDHLNSSLNRFQTQKNLLGTADGLEQLENFLGPITKSREKWRKELWLTAIKLILSGFFVQLKNLETERNKMLYQLQSNDIENFNSLVVAIFRKENFIKSIKHQMKSLKDSYQERQNKETATDEEKV